MGCALMHIGSAALGAGIAASAGRPAAYSLDAARAALLKIGDRDFQVFPIKIGQNDVKIEKFSTFPNGPKWIKVASKWSKMAPKRIFGPFGPVFVSFGSVPPSIWGGYPPRAGGTLRSPGSGWEAPPGTHICLVWPSPKPGA